MPFIKLYTAGVTDTNYLLLDFAILFTVTETMYCIRHPYLIVVQATGNYEATKKGAMAEALINIAVSLVLVIFIGLNGVIIGTLIANVFRTVQYALFISHHIIKDSICGSVRLFLWFLLNSFIIVIIDLLIGGFLSVSVWGDWILYGFICVTVAASVSGLMSFVFYREQLEQLLKMGKRFIKR